MRNWVVIALTLLGAALRLYRIDWQSALADENFSLKLADMTFAGMNAGIAADAVHPPLHYWFLWIWMKIFGFGQLQSRLVSALFGTLSIPLVYLFARRLAGRSTALLAATIFTVSQFAVHHSQEGRMYAMATFLTLCTALLFLIALERATARYWTIFALSAAAMLLTHYFTAHVLFALWLYLLLERRDALRAWRTWLAFLAPAGVLGLWVIAVILPNLMKRPTFDGGEVMIVRWYTPISSLNWFHSGKWNGIYFESPYWSVAAGFTLFFLPATVAVWPRLCRGPLTPSKLTSPAAKLLLLLAACPFFLVIAKSALLHLQFDVRYVVFALPFYYVLVAAGLSRLTPQFLHHGWIAALLLYSTASLSANYTIVFKSDYRAACAWVISSFEAGDGVLFLPSGTTRVPEYWPVHGRAQANAPVVPYDDFAAGSSSRRRIWVIWDRGWFRKNHKRRTTEDLLRDSAANNELIESRKFTGVDVWLFRPK